MITKKSIKRFRKVFGAKSLKVRLFAKECFEGDSLITDFLGTTGIDLPKEKLLFPERVNESISWLGLDVLRRLNAKQPMFLDDGAHNPIRAGVPHLFQSAFRGGKKFALPPEIASRYQTAYEASNEWVRQEYFPDRKRLFIPTSQGCHQGLIIDDHEIDEIADLLNLMLTTKSRTSDSLSTIELLKIIARKSRARLSMLRNLWATGG